ncbi:MAG: plasmid mobilization protein [Paraclostridium sp.]
MDRKLVQIYLSQDEYDILKLNANNAGMSISDYIRSCTIKNDSGIPYYLDLAIDRIGSVSSGSYFSLSTLIGDDWPNICKGKRIDA